MARPLLGRRRRNASETVPAAAAEADAFLCYSRRDRAFVERLHAALVGGGKEVYVDWEDIPDWSPDYESELFSGVDASDALVFVLSPDSLSSPHCKIELDRATEQGKRIRPVLCRDPGEAAVPDALRLPQWIDFRDGRFDDAAARLLQSLSIDAGWVRAHTRIGLRANEWERRGRDASFLLRGSDLRDAERWLDEQRGNEPAPTQLQIQYLIAGRRAATRRQRTTLAAILLALVVAVGLAAVAYVQWGRAVDQRDQTRSVALAGAALDQVDSHPDVALLLALEAYRQTLATHRANLIAQATSALVAARESVGRSGVELILRGHTDLVAALAFSPDGRTLATAGYDRSVRLWDVVARKPLGRPLVGHTDRIRGIAFGDGHTIATASYDRTIRLWDTRTGKQRGRPLRGNRADVEDVAFSPDRRLLASAGLDGTVRLWDTRTHEQTWVGHLGVPSFYGGAYSVAFSPGGEVLAAGGDDGRIRLWNARTHRLVAKPDVGHSGTVFRLAFSPDGSLLASAGDDGTARLWDVRKRRRLWTSPQADSSIFSVAFSRDGRILATAGFDGTIGLWDVRTRRSIGRIIHGTDPVRSIAFGRGHTLAAGGYDGTAQLWTVPVRPTLGRRVTGDPRSATSVAFSRDGKLLASGGADRAIHLWNVATERQIEKPLRGHGGVVIYTEDGPPRGTTSARGKVEAVAFRRQSPTLASGGDDETVRLWNVRTHREIGDAMRVPECGLNDCRIFAVAFSPDGRTLAAAGYDGLIRIWDTRTHEQVRTLGMSNALLSPVSALAYSPDGRLVVSASSSTDPELWNVGSGRRIRMLRGHTGRVWSVAFSPDGRTLATGGADTTVRLWSAATGRLLGQPLRGHAGSVRALAFSPDGRTLVSGGRDGTLRLWDVQTQQPLGRSLASNRGAVRSVAFSPDGGTLATAGDDGSVRLWKRLLWPNVRALTRQVCRLVVGDLSEEEWAAYAPTLPYTHVCND